jgi:hypothetical protein
VPKPGSLHAQHRPAPGTGSRGRHWLDEIAAGTVTDVEHIAAREKCSVRKVNMTISLADEVIE